MVTGHVILPVRPDQGRRLRLFVELKGMKLFQQILRVQVDQKKVWISLDTIVISFSDCDLAHYRIFEVVTNPNQVFVLE